MFDLTTFAKQAASSFDVMSTQTEAHRRVFVLGPKAVEISFVHRARTLIKQILHHALIAVSHISRTIEHSRTCTHRLCVADT